MCEKILSLLLLLCMVPVAFAADTPIVIGVPLPLSGKQMQDGRMIKIFERELQPGEFIFQADTGEEKHYGNDLWHYVTPFVILDPARQGKRDIIGLDVSIAHGN